MSSHANQGGLWENTRKFNPSDPDYTGVININGQEYKFVGWNSTSKHPKAPKINIKVNYQAMPPVFQTTAKVASVPPPAAVANAKVVDDDVPF